MKITDSRLSTRANFEDLREGDVFGYSDNFYMKTEAIMDIILGIESNAIKLSDGTFHRFGDDVNVTRVNCELVIH